MLKLSWVSGRIWLSVSTVNHTYKLSGMNHVTPFRKYRKHLTGLSTYGPRVRTNSKLFSCKSVLTVCGYRAQSNEICTYGGVSRKSLPRVHRYGLLYLRTVEHDHWQNIWVALVAATWERSLLWWQNISTVVPNRSKMVTSYFLYHRVVIHCITNKNKQDAFQHCILERNCCCIMVNNLKLVEHGKLGSSAWKIMANDQIFEMPPLLTRH